LTAAVGCALLLLNAIVFAATFCQWRKLISRTRKSPLSATTKPDDDDDNNKFHANASGVDDDSEQRDRRLFVAVMTSLKDSIDDGQIKRDASDVSNGGCVLLSTPGAPARINGDYFIPAAANKKFEYRVQLPLTQTPPPTDSPASTSTTHTDQKYRSPNHVLHDGCLDFRLLQQQNCNQSLSVSSEDKF
jgi:hypothetical protein